jgi:hypothetical protein
MRRAIFLACLALSFSLISAQENDPVTIDWEPDNTTVSGVVEVHGTVNPVGLFRHFLEVAPYDPDSAEEPIWTPISLLNATPVEDGVLGEWDTTLFPDGLYQLRIHILIVTSESLFYTLAPIAIANNGSVDAADEVEVIATPQVELESLSTPEPILIPSPDITNDLPLEVGGHVLYFSDEAQERMHDTGLTWAKWQAHFQLGDDVAIPRDVINRTHAAGFKILISVTGSVDELRDLGDEYYPLFAEYLGLVAELEPDAIEVWNEMNIDREWPRGRINPRAYAQMLQPAYEAIKAANPDVMVITGALSPTGAEGAFGADRVWNDDNYYFGMVNAGVANYADCIGIHYNEGNLAPNLQGGDPRGNYPTRFLPLMLERVGYPFRNADTSLCFTELGYLSPEGYGPLPGNFAWASSTSVEEQATWLAEAIQIVADYERVPVRLLIIWNIDFDRYDDDPQGGYAIIRPDGDCPACETISELRDSRG